MTFALLGRGSVAVRLWPHRLIVVDAVIKGIYTCRKLSFPVLAAVNASHRLLEAWVVKNNAQLPADKLGRGCRCDFILHVPGIRMVAA